MKRICALICVCVMLTVLSGAAIDIQPAGDGLRGIMLCTLPETGRLMYGKDPVHYGQVVLAEDLGQLHYLPSGREPEAFDYIEVYENGEAGPVISCVLASDYNEAPQASACVLRTWRNLTACGVFRASDPDGDALEYKIIASPTKGRVSCIGSEFVYTPYTNKSGDDSFTYIVRDAYGAWSEEATVSVEIQKKDAPVEYKDMETNRAQYAAVRLYDEGIYTGASYGGSYCFAPDEPLSRGEFIAMALSAAHIEPTVCASTVFEDNDAIPVWARGYIAAAAQQGLLQGGYDESGALICRAGDSISVGEAVHVLERICADASNNEVFVSAAVDLRQQEQSLTRADAAVMLCRVLDFQKDGETIGLFGWTTAA